MARFNMAQPGFLICRDPGGRQAMRRTQDVAPLPDRSAESDCQSGRRWLFRVQAGRHCQRGTVRTMVPFAGGWFFFQRNLRAKGGRRPLHDRILLSTIFSSNWSQLERHSSGGWRIYAQKTS